MNIENNDTMEEDETFIIVVGDDDDDNAFDVVSINAKDVSYTISKDNSACNPELNTDNGDKSYQNDTDNNDSMITVNDDDDDDVISKSICRLCLIPLSEINNDGDIYLLSIMDAKLHFSDDNIFDVIECCTGLALPCDDSTIPNKICNLCLSNLENCWVFRQQCRKSDKLLNEMKEATTRFCRISSNMPESNNSDLSDTDSKVHVKVEEGNNRRRRLEEASDGDSSIHSKKMRKVNNDDISSLVITKTMNRNSNKKSGESNHDEPHDSVNNDEHPEKYVKYCKICRKVNNSADEIIKHARTCHPEDSLYNCDICYDFFGKERDLTIHIKKYHFKDYMLSRSQVTLLRKIICNLCDKKISRNFIADHCLEHC